MSTLGEFERRCQNLCDAINRLPADSLTAVEAAVSDRMPLDLRRQMLCDSIIKRVNELHIGHVERAVGGQIDAVMNCLICHSPPDVPVTPLGVDGCCGLVYVCLWCMRKYLALSPDAKHLICNKRFTKDSTYRVELGVMDTMDRVHPGGVECGECNTHFKSRRELLAHVAPDHTDIRDEDYSGVAECTRVSISCGGRCGTRGCKFLCHGACALVRHYLVAHSGMDANVTPDARMHCMCACDFEGTPSELLSHYHGIGPLRGVDECAPMQHLYARLQLPPT